MTTPSASSSREAREAGAGGPPQPALARARASLQISGMTCAACQARVQKALAGAPGVVVAGSRWTEAGKLAYAVVNVKSDLDQNKAMVIPRSGCSQPNSHWLNRPANTFLMNLYP